MSESLLSETLLARLREHDVSRALQHSLTGIEKEGLRVSQDGSLSQSGHPRSLGSTLTHPWITTDYSEAMIELITPPMPGIKQTLDFLRDIHAYVYCNLRDNQEILWATSMPCILAGATNIPIATYGTSNAGKMKHLYRVGLGHRYGKVMQVISGVHFNFSFADAFWDGYAKALGEGSADRPFRDHHYMRMIRNIQRYGWLIPYLFGTSPAVCRSFFGDHTPEDLETFDEGTYFLPFATSLRMSDIGYQNKKEEDVGIKANYDSLETYIGSLGRAIQASAPAWEAIGLRDKNGQYRQLNTNILQIENEYYSTVRPKQTLQGMEMPTIALQERGIRYVELRSLDIDAFDPLGISEEAACFLETFLLFCLLADSPLISEQERHEIDDNLLVTARSGRDPACTLVHKGKPVSLKSWGSELLESMRPAAKLIDCETTANSVQALEAQIAKIQQPELTPSARMLDEMREHGESFHAFARDKSLEHRHFFAACELLDTRRQELDEMAVGSIEQQRTLEANDQQSFDAFLSDYFEQAKQLRL